ncbi:hypothetical protein HS041_21120 [Planomonospora sp. ID67723]|uniref:hypothetical protein n=1 Tax=Planomonospora sp. ID67723 TaxID=2738134 RepID=UPI0018C43CCA|nr:hypothetical protein [Planomonospora sp. ID67723]MBG0830270.1 hypothetical protein [Planomonospora sp. ID67723]
MRDLWKERSERPEEAARLIFRDAVRELRQAMGRYDRARQAIDAGHGSPAELARSRQAWSWALTEWVRSLIAREEARDGAAPEAGEQAPQETRFAGLSSVPGTLREARLRVEVYFREYDRARRRGGSPADLVTARRTWGRALEMWACELVAQEEAADHARRLAWSLGEPAAVPAGGSAEVAARRADEIVRRSRERARAHNIATRGRPSVLPSSRQGA